MTPRGLDADVIRQKLSLIEASLDTLQSLGEVTARRLADDPVEAAAVERLLTRVVDLAVDVNSHAASSLLGRHPGGYAESFRMASTAGLLPADLAERLAGSAGMRNVIVHQYAELDRDLVAAAVAKTIEGYRDYVTAVAGFVVESRRSTPEGRT